MLERRIYGEGEWAREIHIWHGASESMQIYDSEEPRISEAALEERHRRSVLRRFRDANKLEDSIAR